MKERSGGLPATVCRKCVAFVTKIHQYRGQCQQAQIDLKEQVTVKRCAVQSPNISKARPSKRQAISRPETEKAEIDAPDIIPLVVREGDTKIRSTLSVRSARTMLDFSSISNPTVSSTEALSVKSTSPVLTSESVVNSSSTITARQVEQIQVTARTKDASVFVDNVMKHCPNVVEEMKRRITDNIKVSCKNLCHRNNGSVLHAGRQNPYGMMINFSFAKLWEEMETNIPYVIEVLNAITGVERDKAKQDLQAKYGFLYSVLMNVRWHELSLVQRLNTLCLIEGGCSKQVQFLRVYIRLFFQK